MARVKLLATNQMSQWKICVIDVWLISWINSGLNSWCQNNTIDVLPEMLNVMSSTDAAIPMPSNAAQCYI